jgi:hypothetical protein
MDYVFSLSMAVDQRMGGGRHRYPRPSAIQMMIMLARMTMLTMMRLMTYPI